MFHPCFIRGYVLAACLCLIVSSAQAADWLTAPSFYSHDPTSGERVAQYSPIGPFYYAYRPDYLKSGYRHNRSSFQFSGSADNLHIVEEWGRPVRPYEEWRFPYRPYAVPYDQWGPPFGGLGPGSAVGPFGAFNGGGYGAGPYGYQGGPWQSQHGGRGGGAPANYADPSQDGYYPSYDQNDRSRYYEPYLPQRSPRGR